MHALAPITLTTTFTTQTSKLLLYIIEGRSVPISRIRGVDGE